MTSTTAITRSIETKVPLEMFQRPEPPPLRITKVRRHSIAVSVRPIMVTHAGVERPVMLYDADGGEPRGQVFEIQDEMRGPRAIEVWVAIDPVTSGEARELLPDGNLGRVTLVSKDIYVRRNGTLFTVPVYEKGSEQTISRWMSLGNGEQQDLYLRKGFRFATAKDVVAMLEKTAHNVAAAVRRKDAEDPLKRDERLAILLKEALVPYRGATVNGALAEAEKMDAEVRSKSRRKGVTAALATEPEPDGGGGGEEGGGTP